MATKNLLDLMIQNIEKLQKSVKELGELLGDDGLDAEMYSIIDYIGGITMIVNGINTWIEIKKEAEYGEN